MARTGRLAIGRMTLMQLADTIDRCRQLGYGPHARVEVVLEITDPRAPENPRGDQPAGSRTGEQEK
ncbi:sterol carrier protein domain-containing protein [Mycolicibacterium mageritense]|uniref:sterol carrier protein domain-containing protein n=1 Tax=Mycolicibacterium mageritense TaxID=53462 RepID=UPI001E3FADA1|nr:sterol carrier protein domain-containing protein [Mycolicibacterium mageritense]GJJ24111.1 hypothetical protein MTY414_77850 [Mycolicibacterium mageritense]